MRAARLLPLALLLSACEIPSFPDELVQFEDYAGNPIFLPEPPGSWDAHLQERGYILREEGIWKMWFTGHARTVDGCPPGTRCHLGYATSDDGLRWTRFAANPIENEHHVEDMQVIHEGDTYYLYSEGLDDRAASMISHDGISWQWEGTLDIRLHDGSPINPGPFGTPTVWHEGDTWYLFYERQDDAVWIATSRDRKVWTHLTDEPVLTPGPEYWDSVEIEIVQIFRYEDRYYALFDGRGTETVWSSGIATSTDLVHWYKHPEPLFPPEQERTSPIIVPDGERCFRLYNMHPEVRVSFSRACAAGPAPRLPRQAL